MSMNKNMGYPYAVSLLADAARMGVEIGGMDKLSATLIAAENAVKTGEAAKQRTGIWASETTTEQLADTAFMAMVGAEVLDGTVARPSIGNVRQAVIDRI